MEKLNGIENLLKFLGDTKIVFPALLGSILGFMFFLPNDLIIKILPQKVIEYSEWIRLVGYFSSVILVLHFITFVMKNIKYKLYRYLYFKKLKNHIFSLSQEEKNKLKILYDMEDNLLVMQDPITISLQNKKVIYICSEVGHHDIRHYRPVICMHYAITKEANEIINKYKIFER